MQSSCYSGALLPCRPQRHNRKRHNSKHNTQTLSLPPCNAGGVTGDQAQRGDQTHQTLYLAEIGTRINRIRFQNSSDFHVILPKPIKLKRNSLISHQTSISFPCNSVQTRATLFVHCNVYSFCQKVAVSCPCNSVESRALTFRGCSLIFWLHDIKT